MVRRRSAFRNVGRSLRRAVRATACVCGDPLAASLLIATLGVTSDGARRQMQSVFDHLLCVELAEKHGLSLEEFMALGPEELIELFWPA